ncbi:hypothetical protein AURDEDRAFT_159470 [Auricularia subglabra TFB-10046 SS5]|nr:hypothetical protein AURDEDRAFT_159470 [Auricularia subglabra TFB-10046 SS5]
MIMRAGTLLSALFVLLAGQAQASSGFSIPFGLVSDSCGAAKCDLLQESMAACGTRVSCLCSSFLSEDLKTCLACLTDGQAPAVVRPIQELINGTVPHGLRFR